MNEIEVLGQPALGQQLGGQLGEQAPELRRRRKVERIRGQRHDDAVGRHESVDGGVRQRRGRVDDDHVVLGPHVVDAEIENAPELESRLLRLPGGQGELGAEQHGCGRDQIDAVPVRRPDGVADRRFRAHRQRQDGVALVDFGIGQDAEQCRQRALRVGVDQQHLVAQQCQALRQRDGGRRFRHAALEIADGDRRSLGSWRTQGVLAVITYPDARFGQAELSPRACLVHVPARQIGFR